MEHNAKNICRTVISGKEQNLKEQLLEFGIPILFQYFMYILTKFNTFSRSVMDKALSKNLCLVFLTISATIYITQI